MFWKSANRYLIISNSLVTKLMILYTFGTVTIVAMVCFCLFPTFEKLTHFPQPVPAESLYSECLMKLSMTLLLSIFSAILFGNLIARYVMRIIGVFTDKIEKITVDSLTYKLNPQTVVLELKPLAEKFNLMLERLDKTYSQLTQFSADLSHELRNSIHHLKMRAELALSKECSSEEYKQILESNIEEYHHLSKLIENLLFLARVDHGQIQLNKGLVSVREQALKILAYHQAFADEHNIKMQCHGDANLHVDPILFKRAIHNLLANALNFTNPSGTINVMIQTDENFVTIAVIDSGIGIASDHIPKLFDRFFRVDESRFSQSGSLGLGLAIVKSIIELHGGMITVESQENIGTTVSIRLPVARVEREARNPGLSKDPD